MTTNMMGAVIALLATKNASPDVRRRAVIAGSINPVLGLLVGKNQRKSTASLSDVQSDDPRNILEWAKNQRDEAKKRKEAEDLKQKVLAAIKDLPEADSAATCHAKDWVNATLTEANKDENKAMLRSIVEAVRKD